MHGIDQCAYSPGESIDKDELERLLRNRRDCGINGGLKITFGSTDIFDDGNVYLAGNTPNNAATIQALRGVNQCREYATQDGNPCVGEDWINLIGGESVIRTTHNQQGLHTGAVGEYPVNGLGQALDGAQSLDINHDAPTTARAYALAHTSLAKFVIAIPGEVLEARKFTPESQLAGANGTITLLANDNFSHAAIR